MGNAYEEARASFKLDIPSNPNFVTHVFDRWAADPNLQAMYWVSAHTPPRIRHLSYAYFAERSHRVAIALDKLGLRKGDRVLMMLPRLPEWWELALGMLRMGVVVVPSTMLLVSKDIEYRLEVSGARAFIGSIDSASHFQKVEKVPKTMEFTILVEDYYNNTPLPKSKYNWARYSEMVNEIPTWTKWSGTEFSMDDPSIIYFTSGTIGMPKMVQHTQVSYPMGSVITGKYWLKLAPGKVYWNTSEQGWAKAAWSFFGTFVHSLSPPRRLFL
jgi:acyl-coenzyme A synthetase/AMP-(fatty) acid ligase